MNKKFLMAVLSIACLFMAEAANAADSFRYLHVTIDTPWMIFIFLLVIILFPFILMAILYWYFAYKKSVEEKNAKQETTAE
jgi:hypothetical protein